MFNHVTLEVHADVMDAEVRWWCHFLGFEEEEPYSDKYGARWIFSHHEGERTQVHLYPVGPGAREPARWSSAIVPRFGHVALVVGRDLGDIEAALRLRGLPVEEGTMYWGTPRFMTTSPSGHRVELMMSGPKPAGER